MYMDYLLMTEKTGYKNQNYNPSLKWFGTILTMVGMKEMIQIKLYMLGPATFSTSLKEREKPEKMFVSKMF